MHEDVRRRHTHTPERFCASVEARTWCLSSCPRVAMLAQVCLRPCQRRWGTMNEAASGACTGDWALCCSDAPSSSSRGAAAAAVQRCDFGTPAAVAIVRCVPEEAAPPASPGISDADTVSTVFWRFCGGPCMGAKAKAPTSSSARHLPLHRL